MNTIDVIAWLILLGGLLTFGCLGMLGLWRKYKAYVYHVRDFRSGSDKLKKYYVIADKNDKSLKYYNNLFTPWMTRKVPLVYEPGSFAIDGKHVRLIRSPTGKPGDDMDVPIGTALNSQASAMDFMRKLSDEISVALPIYNTFKTHDYRIGERGTVEFVVRGKNGKLGDVKSLDATITGVARDGITVSYELAGKKQARTLREDEIQEFKSSMSRQQKLTLPEFDYSDFFTAEWLMQRFGITRVEDASIITIPSKQAIARFNSGGNEFVKEGAPWLERHSGVVIGVLILFVAGLTAYFVMQGGTAFYQGIAGDVGALAQNLGVHGNYTIPTTTVGSAGPIQIGG
jgi:hypothetical protein